jgi:hypothetical protein
MLSFFYHRQELEDMSSTAGVLVEAGAAFLFVYSVSCVSGLYILD